MINTVTDAKYFAKLYLLALAVYREARGESFYGKLLVAQTIRCRVEDPRWPNTYEKVITQPWQFSAFNKHDPNAVVYPFTGDSPNPDDKAWLDSIDAAQKVLNENPVPPKHHANHYHSLAVKPRWSEGVEPVVTEGNHVFFRL